MTTVIYLYHGSQRGGHTINNMVLLPPYVGSAQVEPVLEVGRSHASADQVNTLDDYKHWQTAFDTRSTTPRPIAESIADQVLEACFNTPLKGPAVQTQYWSPQPLHILRGEHTPKIVFWQWTWPDKGQWATVLHAGRAPCPEDGIHLLPSWSPRLTPAKARELVGYIGQRAPSGIPVVCLHRYAKQRIQQHFSAGVMKPDVHLAVFYLAGLDPELLQQDLQASITPEMRRPPWWAPPPEAFRLSTVYKREV